MEEYRLSGIAEEFSLRVEASGRPLSDAERVLAGQAARALQWGLEQRAPEVLALAQAVGERLQLSLPSSPSARGASLESAGAIAELGRQISEELFRGRISVERLETPSLRERDPGPPPELPPRPPAKPEGPQTFFDVRFVDEVGQAIGGLGVEFDAEGELHELSTNPAGVALLENVIGASASVSVPEPEPLEDLLDPRWEKPRPGSPPKVGNSQSLVFRGAPLGPFGVKAAVPNTIIVKPPLGKLFVELFDKAGQVRHAEQRYSITGPQSFEGETDAEGRLLHEDVFPGDYVLSLTLTFFEGDQQRTDTYEAPLVVLPAEASDPEVRMIGAVPRVVLARLHAFFNTNKTFLLPTAFPSLKKLRALYADNDPCELLVVGHADTAGGAEFNDELSLARAKSMIAFLEDDVDAWLAFYDEGMPPKQRWGSPEDRMMISAMPDFVDKPKGQNAVEWFQETRGLTVDGKAGPETRTQLITEYMALDGVSLASEGLSVTATAHGAGENFPLEASGEELDQEPADEKRDHLDRRVELFFFDKEFGIVPAPPGDNSAAGGTEYPEWRERSLEVHEFSSADAEGPALTFAELADALFRTNSAVVLPEGEVPADDPDSHEALRSFGVFATALRFNHENAGRKLLVAGHTDTTASVDFNQKLSEERAGTGLALLEGGDASRESWKALCDGRHTVADYKQILAWASREFPGFACDPGAIDDNAATGVEPVKRFQAAYNANKAALAATAPDLKVDGAVGPLTWGAIFDCYEAALAKELGVDADELAELRSELVFVDDEHQALGFSEHFPIEELGVDNHRSQVNRRVEILFFKDGEEPDIEHAASDPETSDVYLPGYYDRVPLDARASAKRDVFTIALESVDGNPVPDVGFVLTLEDGTEKKGRLDANGTAVIDSLPPDTSYLVEYLDHDDIRAKCLAGRLRKALDAGETDVILGVISRPKAMFDLVRAAVEQFFPGSGDLVEEIRDKTKGSEHASAVDYFLVGLGLVDLPEQQAVAYNEPEFQPDTTDAALAEGDTRVV